jgi:predicted signal transduction protein with EAL and GGDEF domain
MKRFTLPGIDYAKVRIYATAAAAGGVVAFLAATAGRSNDNLRVEYLRQSIQTDLNSVVGSLERQINFLVGGKSSDRSLVSWDFDGKNLRLSGNQSAVHEQLTAAITRASSGPLLVLPAADGNDYVVVRTDSAPASLAWHAAGLPLEALLIRAGIPRMIRAGLDIQIADAESRRLLFQSRPAAFNQPVIGRMAAHGARWQLVVQPHAGWGAPLLTRWLLVVLMGAGTAFWVFRFAQRPLRLRAELKILSTRLHHLNTTLTEALRVKEQTEKSSLALAQIDGASGLPNRKSLCEAMERELSAIRGSVGTQVTVIVIRFESLREVTNAYGLEAGDRVLREASTRIQAFPGVRGTLGRISETELALWTKALDSRDKLEQWLTEELSRPYRVGAFEAYVTFGVGLSILSDGFAYADEVLHQASSAAQEAVEQRSGAVCLFEPKTRARTVNRLEMESDLRRSLEGDGLVLHYQPIVRADSARVVGFEALLRWLHPLEGLLLPGKFLPIAESGNLQLEMDRWVLRQSILQAQQWSLDAGSDFFISFNLSQHNFARPELVREISDALADANVPPKHLRLEIIESALVCDVEVAARVAAELRELGVRICLDDFGTGYSSLSYLRTLPIDSIKVDRSFVERMVTNTKDFGVVKAIIDLAHYLELSCVVEGVETSEQRELLEVLGAEMYQGYLYSPPLPAEQAESLLREPASRSALQSA